MAYEEGEFDISLAHGPEKDLTLHYANCKAVRCLAASGYPVATFLGCKSIPMNIKRHDCMRKAYPDL